MAQEASVPLPGLWRRTRAGPLFLPLSQRPGNILAITGSCSAPPFWREGLSGSTGPWPQPWVGAPTCRVGGGSVTLGG